MLSSKLLLARLSPDGPPFLINELIMLPDEGHQNSILGIHYQKKVLWGFYGYLCFKCL